MKSLTIQKTDVDPMQFGSLTYLYDLVVSYEDDEVYILEGNEENLEEFAKHIAK